MRLDSYLSMTGENREHFAVRLGVSEHAVGKWLRGERTPRSEQLRAIFEATGGAVTANDFVHATPVQEGAA